MKTKNPVWNPGLIRIALSFSSKFSGLINGTVYYLTFLYEIHDGSGSETVPPVFTILTEIRDRFPLVQLAEYASSEWKLHLKVDLPCFTEIHRNDFLSTAEISGALRQLSGAAECIRDLQTGSFSEDRYPITQGNDSTPFTLHSGWQVMPATGTICLLQTFVAQEPLSVTECLKFNNDYQFVTFHSEGRRLTVRLCYCAADIQDDERELLERWFDFVINDRRIRERYAGEKHSSVVDRQFTPYMQSALLGKAYKWFYDKIKTKEDEAHHPDSPDCIQYMNDVNLDRIRTTFNTLKAMEVK